MQDGQGFIWIGTQNGLNRYDGYEFMMFKNNPRNPNSLTSNQVMSLLEDREGVIWVGTAMGLNRFDRATQTFSAYRHEPGNNKSLSHSLVLSLAEDGDGNLWVGTYSGLNRFDKQTGTSTRYYNTPHFPGSLANNQIKALLVDSRQQLWVGTEDGLDRLDATTGLFNHFRADPHAPDMLKSNHITTLMEDSTGLVWIGTMEGGISGYNPENNSFMTYRQSTIPSGVFHDNISGISEDKQGNLWITTFKGISTSGLFHFDRKKQHVTRFAHDPDNPYSITWSYSTAVFVDRSGILWAGCSRGLDKFDLQGRKFKLYRQFPGDTYNILDNFYGLYMDDRDRVWLGLDLPGFLMLDRNTGVYKLFTDEGVSLDNVAGGGIYSIEGDGEGRLWIGSGDTGLRLFDPESERTLLTFRHDPADPQSLSNDFVTTIKPEEKGKVWVGTNGGLNLLDRETGRFRVWQHDFNDSKTLSGNQISVIYRDRAGVLWVGTGGNSRDSYMTGPAGLNRMHGDELSFSRYQQHPDNSTTISSNWVYDLYEDGRGRFWVATGNGLNLMNRETGTFSYFLEKDGLPSDTVINILEDGSNRLWLSTQNGLSCFYPDTGVFRNYDVEDGLQQARFNTNSHFQASSGEMFFGGTGGLNAFFPDDIHDDPYQPPIVLTDFKLFNSRVPIGEGSVLPRHVSLLDELNLTYDQNSFSFSFAALHFSRPVKNRYSFYLENYEETWREPGDYREAHYTNLDPGRYVFRVKAANKDGVWNEEGISIDVLILPPWWRTLWAGIAYVLMAMGLLYGLIHFQIERTRRKMMTEANREREEARLREAELARLAAEAQARAIEADHRRKTEELEQARQLQLSMLPKTLPGLDYLEIDARSTTATEVGGDYFDFKIGADNALTVAVGDATGHGMQAGIMVAATKSLFNAMAEMPDLTQILNRTSAALKGMGLQNMYMGMTLARFRGRELNVTSAGMPFPLLWRATPARVEELPLRAMPLGALVDFEYQNISLELDPGDTLLFMSDGLPETFNEKMDMLGAREIKRVFAETADRPIDVLADRLLNASRSWAGERLQDDDVTLVVIRYR